MTMLKLQDSEVDQVRDFVLSKCGVALDPGKGYLIESRLGVLCSDVGIGSYARLIDAAQTDPLLSMKIVDAITTNETMFFRDGSPFDALAHKAAPELIDAKEGTEHSRRIRVWSAASSTGQEAYSIAIVLKELIPDISDWDVEILGTDVSHKAIQKAQRGVYSKYEVDRGVTAARLEQNFTSTDAGWSINEDLRALCRFEQRDLTKPLRGLDAFDIVFCRNVAIYFNAAARRNLFEEIMSQMNPEGYLFVGSTECLSDLGYPPHMHCRSVFYRTPRFEERAKSVPSIADLAGNVHACA